MAMGKDAPHCTGVFFASDEKAEEMRQKGMALPRTFKQEKTSKMPIKDRIYGVNRTWVLRNLFLAEEVRRTKDEIKDLVRDFAHEEMAEAIEGKTAGGDPVSVPEDLVAKRKAFVEFIRESYTLQELGDDGIRRKEGEFSQAFDIVCDPAIPKEFMEVVRNFMRYEKMEEEEDLPKGTAKHYLETEIKGQSRPMTEEEKRVGKPLAPGGSIQRALNARAKTMLADQIKANERDQKREKRVRARLAKEMGLSKV